MIRCAFLGVWVLCLTVLFYCSGSDGRADGDENDDSAGDADSDGDGDGDGDSDGDADDDDDDSGDDSDDICDEDIIPLVHKLPRLMILEDVSGSMVEDPDGNPVEKWNQAKAALTDMTKRFEDEVDFGLDIFPDGRRCSVQNPIILDAAAENAQNIIDELEAINPDGSTPLYDAEAMFLQPNYAPEFTSPTANSYLLIVTDGQDTCGINGNQFDEVQPQDLADITTQLLEERDIKTFVIGFGDGVDANQLNAIAENGGTRFTEYLIADDQDSLEEALKDIIETLISCVYEIEHPDAPYVDRDKVNFYYEKVDDDHLIPQDDGCRTGTGWTWRNPPENTIVEFCEDTCKMLQDENIETIIIQYGCEPIIVN